MGCLDWLARCVSALLLITINVFLALGGGLVLYVAVFVRHTGWVEVVQAYWSPINGLATTLIVVAGVVIGMALLGTIAALCRWRAGLCYYMVFVLLVLLLFALVGVCAFLLWRMFSNWEDDAYPASGSERDVKADFDQVYCYAQGVYICNEGSVSDALSMFAPDLNSTVTALFENMTGGVNTLCDEYLSEYEELTDVCDGCDKAREFQHFSSVLEWSNNECPRVASTLSWCGEFFLDGSAANVTTGTAPYTHCRNAFLDLVSNYALYLAIGSVIVVVGSVAVIIMSCYLRRHDMYDVYEAYRE
ncbi:hypothetical protein PHYSODRAFT_319934 [Phytophthora sojae]|uniref:Uncharacterized protein n=1 Tax=Phytophthora sojae (strain P6497) TaxID=1094619 RepID=G5AEV2_PHYSP|nr:hypothetical protein PHYSODRAFT_319934 [Phytophthora sojae]EGZ05742.1 hypothetical protein PHYSODRAFT_319934 [Phytophthora sojae]|eukprot:XP_009538603.1 hypothetical protein PHYSODRAFT_319934 [Phytophthora sojae]